MIKQNITNQIEKNKVTRKTKNTAFRFQRIFLLCMLSVYVYVYMYVCRQCVYFFRSNKKMSNKYCKSSKTLKVPFESQLIYENSFK